VLLHLLGALVRDAGDGLFAAAEGCEHFGLDARGKAMGNAMEKYGKHTFFIGKPMKNKKD
jgi:nitrite reductase/ring-hydroxylating ferredoxin subunit